MGGATAHQAVKSPLGAKKEYAQPTHTIKTKEGINSDPNQMHKAFTEEWAKKVLRLQRQKPDWKKFQEEYGEYIPQVPYTHGTINGEDMYKTVQQIGKTVPGLDGWRIHELKALGVEAWQQRARIVEVQLKTGRVPASYKQVSTPMMPKAKGTEVIMEHRGLAIFSILWRVESGAWYRRLAQWQEEWLPEGIHGARSGHECLSSAWPAQARIEQAMLEGKDRAAATLDYTKFFDWFDPHFLHADAQSYGISGRLGKHANRHVSRLHPTYQDSRHIRRAHSVRMRNGARMLPFIDRSQCHSGD